MMLPQCRCTSARTTSTAWRRRLSHSSHRTALRSGTLAAAVLALGVSTASVGRPTRLLRQSTTNNNATASPAAAGSTASAEVSAPPPAASTMSCYDTFLFSQDDLHLRLLQEAHRKHGVWLTVPPQLAPTVPNVGPPAIPEPMYPPKQRERFEALERGAAEARRARGSRSSTYAPTDVLADPNCLAYTPTHLPPPFITTGTHNFRMAGGDVADVQVVGADATQSAAGAVAVHATASAVMMEVAVRAPVDASMLFHCSACGRAFRRREAAEAHVRQRHDNTGKSADAAARVVEGGGPGEITGYKTVLGSPSHPTAASRANISSAANQPRGVVCTDATAAKSATEASTTTAAAATAPAEETKAPAAETAEFTAMPLPPPAALLRKRGESLVSAAYRAAPAVHLPEEHLVDELLASVWDDVALHREDIEKAGKSSTSPSAAGEAVPATAVDSCNGRFFIPSSSFVEGKADNRAELEAELAGKTLARATPAGAAPGIKRRTVNVTPATVAARRLMVARLGEDGNVDAAAAVASAAPTAQELSITELSRHYPNPFGDSPNAALIEQEKEPANPFRDLEAEGEKEKGEGEAGTAAADATATPEQRWSTWQQRFAARPYACPLCQRKELPQLATLLNGSSSTTAGAGAGAAAASPSPSSSPAAPCTASLADEVAWRQYETRVPRFRLLDSLDNHIESCHAEGNPGSSSGEVTEEEWQRLYAVEASPTDAAARELRAVQLAVRVKEGSANTNGIAAAPARRAAASSSTATSEKLSSASSATASDATATEDGGENSTEKADEDAAATTADGARDALAGAEAPHVHVRAAVNTVLVGEVRDVQEGFVGSMRVLQYVVAVHNGSPCSASEGGEEKEEEAVADEDLIVVRCMGDLVPVALLHQRVQLGSTLFVAGSLRMNRSIDTASRRSHAYPYVQVVPPLGFVRVVK